jgi:hypothetical protein
LVVARRKPPDRKLSRDLDWDVPNERGRAENRVHLLLDLPHLLFATFDRQSARLALRNAQVQASQIIDHYLAYFASVL